MALCEDEQINANDAQPYGKGQGTAEKSNIELIEQKNSVGARIKNDT